MLSLTEKDKQRYWAKVEVKGLNECWPWLAGKSHKGYGLLSFFIGGKKTSFNAHKVGMILRLGSIAGHAMHSCDNPECQNPCHVYPGTNAENIADKMAKGRHRGARGERCKNHKLTTEQVQAIRRNYATGQYYQSQLGEQYGVNQQQISRIVNRQRWAHAA